LITIELPRALGPYAEGQTTIVLDKPHATVGSALAALGDRSPGALDRVMNERGDVRPHVNVFVNGESIRFLNGLDTPTPDGSSILIVAAVSGG
jgi:molybdopterin synthase sulfur carrier subunit